MIQISPMIKLIKWFWMEGVLLKGGVLSSHVGGMVCLHCSALFGMERRKFHVNQVTRMELWKWYLTLAVISHIFRNAYIGHWNYWWFWWTQILYSCWEMSCTSLLSVSCLPYARVFKGIFSYMVWSFCLGCNIMQGNLHNQLLWSGSQCKPYSEATELWFVGCVGKQLKDDAIKSGYNELIPEALSPVPGGPEELPDMCWTHANEAKISEG